MKADVLIIGGGGVGLTAAIAAAEKGAKNIVILEASDHAGGNAVYAAAVGYNISMGPPQPKAASPEAKKDEAFQSTMEFTHWRTNASVVRAIVEKNVGTKQWLEKLGVEFAGTFDRVDPKGPRIGRKITDALLKTTEKMGARILYRTKATKLLTDRAGNVTGAVAKAKGKEMTVTAKSVIVATGGIFSNKKLMKKHFPQYEYGCDMYIGGETRNGDGLLMATKLGAATEPEVAPETSVNRTPWSAVQFLIAKDPAMLLVNKKGKRFVDESARNSQNALFRQPGMTSYALYDENTKQAIYKQELIPIDKYVLGASMLLDVTDKKLYATTGEKGLFATYKNWTEIAEKDWKYQEKLGQMKSAGTWDALAKWMGVDPKALKATIDGYNALCAKGHDDLFAKDKKFLRPLSKPPFYAIHCHPLVIVTHGGLKVTEKMESVTVDGDPIPGLYIAGCDATLSSTDTYSGDALGWHINSGRIAGENAAKYASGKA
jgi:fumarate reductase flavoprotein subunit